MARIDLVNVSKTFTDRDRRASGTLAAGEIPDWASVPPAIDRGTAFSIKSLNLTIHDGETLVVRA